MNPRRRLIAAAMPRAQHQSHHGGQFERLNQPGRINLPELQDQAWGQIFTLHLVATGSGAAPGAGCAK